MDSQQPRLVFLSKARRSADSSSTPVKRYEDDASSGRIWCKGCRYPASTTRQCEGGFEQCQPGEVCATKIPDHPSATDGCVEANACKILSDLGVFSSCCAHDFCNLLKVRSGD